MTTPPDAIRALTGDLDAASLYAGGEIVDRHGPLDRLPAFLREGMLSSARTMCTMCTRYRGKIQVVNSLGDHGLQTGTTLQPSEALALGPTVFVQDLGRQIPKAVPWLRGIEAAAGAPPGAATLLAFANAPGSGLAIHHDPTENLLIHLVGRKTLEVCPNGFVTDPHMSTSPVFRPEAPFGEVYQSGFAHEAHEVPQRAQTVEFEPGSIVYLPNGTWHATTGQSEQTLSALIRMSIPSVADLLVNHLHAYLRQSARWRAHP